MLFGALPLAAQQSDADQAWSQGRYGAARQGYERVLRRNPNAVRANLRLGILLSWDGKLDSALVLIARARAADRADAEMALVHARVRAWDGQYSAALALYDSLLSRQPELRDALLGRAQTLAWAGRLQVADSVYGALIQRNTSDREARLGQAQVTAWRGELRAAEAAYHEMLAQNPRDVDAATGLAYVYYWQGNVSKARRQLEMALAADSMHRTARELKRTIAEATRPALEATAAWSNDSDRNTSFWQTLGSSVRMGGGLSGFGSVTALETQDPFREGTRLGGEAGLLLALSDFSLTAAAGARRIMPEIAASRTAATYRGRAAYRPMPALGFNAAYSRSTFDETAALMQGGLDMELLDGGFDARPFRGFSIYAAGSELWLSDGNRRSGFLAGLSQTLYRRFSVGLFGRTLTYERRGVGYFSPDRFSVLEATAAYGADSRTWGGSIGGGLGAQQVGERGDAQTEWHVEGRLGRRWGVGNRIELFGLLTNSAVSSTTGAFRYRSAGLNVRVGL
jgi:tetratricopeptide (TPR) repeat protein